MDESFPVDLLRNVQPTDRKLSVSKEFVGPKRQDEKGHKRPHHDASHHDADEGEKHEKPVKLYGRELPSGNSTGEEGTKIDITI